MRMHRSISVATGVGLMLNGMMLEGAAPRFKGSEHWDLYGDFLYMKRTDLNSTSLVKEAGHTVIRSKDLIHQFDFEPGYRIGLVYSPNVKNGFETNFLYLSPWEGTKSKKRNQSLSFPFTRNDYDQDFTNADDANARYTAQVWDVELNFWRYFTPRLSDYFGLSGLIGVRFFHWDEHFKLQMTHPPDVSSYKIKTQNRIIGFQLGFDFQMHPMRWLTWELLAKGGVFANSTEQSQFLGDFNNLLAVRDSTTQKWQAGFYADTSAQIRIECRSWLNIHLGYEALFLTGLSLAPEQVSKSVGSHAGRKDYTSGNGVIHGLFTGVTFRF